jgi:hypothetical protein
MKMAGKLTSFRTSEETRERLVEAAERRGVSINQEINDRIDASFAGPDLSERTFKNKGLYGLMRLVAVAMQISGQQALIFKNNAVEGSDLWYRDPYAFDQAVQAAMEVFKGCRPDGSRAAPANHKDPAINDLQSRVGKSFADNVLSEVAVAAPGGRGEILRADLDPTTLAQILKDRGVST